MPNICMILYITNCIGLQWPNFKTLRWAGDIGPTSFKHWHFVTLNLVLVRLYYIYVRPMLAQRWTNVVYLTNFRPKQRGTRTFVQRRANVISTWNTTKSCFKTSRRCILAQRFVKVVFSTKLYPNQSGRHTLVQYWPNVNAPNATHSY